MAFGRSKDKSLVASAAVVQEPPSRSLVSSALRFRFDDASYINYTRFRDEAWQREVWRLFKVTPELHYAASWVGQCCSQVRIYVANVDALGRVQGETKNRKIQALSDTLLGGPASKAEHLRMMGIDLTISGECYIIGRPDNHTGRDRWYIVTPTEFRRIKGSNGDWDWAWGPKENPIRLDLEKSIVTRVWTPDPERVWCSDSPTRACQPILRELEQLTKYVAAQIDSRLVGAGILIIPNDLELPAEEGMTNSADSLMYRLATAGAASLKGEGTALGVLPHIVEANNADGFKLLTFDSELSKQAMELRDEAVRRLGVGMDMPPEVLSGTGSSNHWCMSMDTQIYTKDQGWIEQKDLAVGDLVMTLNPESGTSEWQPVEAVNVFDVVDEPMLRMENNLHSSLSTGNHRWLGVTSKGDYQWTTSAEGFRSRLIPIAARNTQTPQQAKYLDDFVRLVAAYTSDGTPVNLEKGNGRPRVHITKFKPYEIQEMRRILGSVLGSQGLEWSETTEYTAAESGVRFHLKAEASEALMAVAPGKFKPILDSFVDDLTESQLMLLLESMIDIGDGVRKGASYVFFQVEPVRLKALERAALLLGRAVQWAWRKQSKGASSERPLRVLTVSRRRHTDPSYAKQEWINFTGQVWCPTTPNGTWLARRNECAFYTGNSGYLVEGQGIKTHIEPLMTRIVEALTEAYLVPALRLMGEDPARYTYAYDTSPLVVRPQRTQDALNLYEKGAISADALREAAYFKQSDAPVDEESARRLLIDILLRDPQLLQNAAIRRAVGITDDILPQIAMVAPTAQSIGLGPSGGSSSGGSGAPPPLPPPTGIQSDLPPPIPDTLGNLGTPPQMPNPGGQKGPRPNMGAGLAAPPTGLTASAAQLQDMGVTVLAEATVRRALELAGKRLLNRENRNRWPDVASFELHTRIKVQDRAHANRLLAGAWDQLNAMTQFFADGFDTPKLQKALEDYCATLLVRSESHSPDALFEKLQTDRVLSG